MKEAPQGFALDRLPAALLESWGIRARDLEYLPVGFGAHHWRATDASKRAYFLALHHLGTRGPRIQQARAGDGSRNRAGGAIHRFTLSEGPAVYPWLACVAPEVFDAPDVPPPVEGAGGHRSNAGARSGTAVDLARAFPFTQRFGSDLGPINSGAEVGIHGVTYCRQYPPRL